MKASKANSPLRAIRAKCLDCSTTSKTVKYCTCDGVNCPTACPLWPFRFGKRPSTARKGPLAAFLDPKRMPDASIPLEQCDVGHASDHPKSKKRREIAVSDAAGASGAEAGPAPAEPVLFKNGDSP